MHYFVSKKTEYSVFHSTHTFPVKWPSAWLSRAACNSYLIESKRIFLKMILSLQSRWIIPMYLFKKVCVCMGGCTLISQWILCIISPSLTSRSTLWGWDDRVVCHLSSLLSPGVKLGQEVRGIKPCASCHSMTQLSFKHSCFCSEVLSSSLLPGSFWFRYPSHKILHFI